MIKHKYNIVLKVFFASFLAVAMALSGGCARSVDVVAEFPTPLVEAYPITAGVRYPSELGNFTHVEDPELEPEWQIRLGEANLRMFRALFAGMFETVIELPTDPAATIDPAIDFIIEPELEELEFSVPNQSGTDQFVVWLKYKLTLLRPDGQLINNWRITAYGQEDQGKMGMGSEEAMKDAAIKALRDAGASIVLGFAEAPGVAENILPKTGAAAALPDTEAAMEQPNDVLPEDADDAEDIS